MLNNSTLGFLKKLKKNNNKAWFDANRRQYEDARKDFENFIAEIIAATGKSDPTIKELRPRDCIFRINRDIRFSKDKSPYKSNFGASITRGGKKSIFAGYYFHCEPGGSFAGGGLWMPMPPEMKKIRQEIDYGWDEFKKIISSRKFKSAFGDIYSGDEIRLSNAPKGYQNDHPGAAYLRLKSWIALRDLSDSDLTSKGLIRKTMDTFFSLRPLLDFLNRGLEE